MILREGGWGERVGSDRLLFITVVPNIKLFARGEGDNMVEDMCYHRKCDEPRLVRTSLPAANPTLTQALLFRPSSLAEGRTAKPELERVRVVLLRWHSSGIEVRLGLPVGL